MTNLESSAIWWTNTVCRAGKSGWARRASRPSASAAPTADPVMRTRSVLPPVRSLAAWRPHETQPEGSLAEVRKGTRPKRPARFFSVTRVGRIRVSAWKRKIEIKF